MEPLDPELQSLVAAERAEVEPRPADRDRVARSLASRVGAGFAVGLGLVSAPAAGATVAGISTGLLVKLGAAVAMVGTVAALTVPNWSARNQAPTPPPPSAPSAAPIALPTPAAEAAPAPVPEETQPPLPTRPDTSARPAVLPPLAEEARLLKQAQQALRDGRAGAALAALNEHQRRFPRGQLSLERSAARIAALCGLGHKAQAEREAKAFLQRHSSSGLAAQVRASCGFAAPSP
jgi:hypothetical protein